MQNRKFKFIIILCSLILLPSILRASDPVNIVLKSGEKYENVSYKIDRVNGLITLEKDGWEKDIRIWNVQSITDINGVDITNKLLGVSRGPDSDIWRSENSEVVRQARRLAWTATLRFGGNYSFPMGDYYDGINSGIGFGGDIRIAVSENIAIKAVVTKTGLTLSNDIHLMTIPEVTILSEDLSFSALKFLIGGEYYRHFDITKQDLSMIYLFWGLGAISHTTLTKATLQHQITGEIAYVDDKYTQTKFAMDFEIGVVKQIFKKTGLDFSGSFDMVAVGKAQESYGAYGNVAYAYILEFKVGIVRYF